jgi:leader peptidase (prepilin peptidase) / N-methyltransferase
MVSPKRRNWPLRLALLALAVLLAGYVFGGPYLTLWYGRSGSGPPAGFESIWLADQIRIRFFETAIAIWIFAFGASIGSFLNVVVYRTPRRLSLLGTSFCPKCMHPIRWFDNLPVFGWIRLGGRCRDCHLRISVRYPLIELITGLMTLGLVVFQLSSGHGSILPGRPSAGYPGLSWLVQQLPWEVVIALLVQAVLLYILLSWALIRWDGYRLPRPYLVSALVFGLASPTFIPAFHPTPLIVPQLEWLGQHAWCRRLEAAAVGALLGGFLGSIQAVISGGWRGRLPPSDRDGRGMAVDLAATVALIGAFLGAQAVVSVLLVAAGVRLIVSTVTGDLLCRHGSSVWIYFVLATFFEMVGWNEWVGWTGWINASHSLANAAIATLCAMYFAWVASYVESRPPMQ